MIHLSRKGFGRRGLHNVAGVIRGQIMNVGQCCNRAVVAVSSHADIVEAAELMRRKHVGFLVVLDPDDPQRRPVGVLTDRDIVLQVIAREVSAHSVTVRDVMSPRPMIAAESDELNELVQGMRFAGIRRAPVVDARGTLSGVIAVDDAIEVIAAMLSDLSGSIKSEQRHERRVRS